MYDRKCMTEMYDKMSYRNVWNVKKCTENCYMYKYMKCIQKFIICINIWNVQKCMKCTECHAWQKCMTENVWYTSNHRRYLGKSNFMLGIRYFLTINYFNLNKISRIFC